MNAVLASFFADPFRPDETKEFLYVCTYQHKSLGAGCVLHPEIQKHFLKIFPEGFFIIFSSIHEAIIVPQKNMKAKELQDMLREINSKSDVIRPEETVTDHIYGVVTPCQLERIVIE